LKVVESLAAGTPVITSDVGDRREVLTDESWGTLVPSGDAAALTAELQVRLQQPQRPLHFGERWYWDTLVHDFEKIYQM
jgi:glycosyltransferase involved in cell wall biosynthesis